MANAGTLWVSVKPSLEGFGQSIRQQLRGELPDGITLGVGADTSELRQRIAEAKAGLEDLKSRRWDPQLDAEATQLEAKIREAEAKLAAFGDRKATATADADVTAAETHLAELKARLDEIGRMRATAATDADIGTAEAKLSALNAELDAINGKRPTARPDVDTSSATSNVSALTAVLAGIGPAAIPAAAAAAAALASIGPAALIGIGGVLSITAAFHGIGDAIKAYSTEQDKAGQNAVSSANQQRSAAYAIASAQDGVRNAVQGVATAQENAASSVRSAINSAITAEENYQSSLRAEQTAQQNLTQARAQAALQLQSLTFQVQDNALSQRQAQIQLQEALATQASNAAPAGSLQATKDQLAVDQARQQITELQAQGKNLGQQKADADRKGIDGSSQVVAAQNAVTDAVRRTGDAQRALQQANDAVTKAQIDGARSVQQAQQQVTAAERSLQQARDSAAASTSSASTATNNYATAMGKLSPAGRDFVNFYTGELKPKLDELNTAAQQGLLPGLQAGIRSAEPVLGQLKTFVGNVSSAFGGLATDAGKALTNPFWHQFFDFLSNEAKPTVDSLGRTFGNFVTGVAGIMQALYQPVFVPIRDWFESLSVKVRDFGVSAAAGTNSGFNRFLDYVRENGPKLRDLLVNLATVVGHLAEGLAGQGGATLTVLNETLRLLAGMDPKDLAALADVFIAIKGLQLAKSGIDSAKAMFDTAKDARQSFVDIKTSLAEDGILGSLRKIQGLGGLAGVLGVAGVVALLQLANQQLQEYIDKNVPKDPAKRTTAQSGIKAAGDALNSTVQMDPGAKTKNTTLQSFFAPGFDEGGFSASYVAKLGRDISTGWGDFQGQIKDKSKQFWSDIKTGWSDLGTQVKGKASDMWSGVTGWTSRLWTDVKTGWSDLKSQVSTKATELKDWVVRKFTELKDGAVGKATELKDWVVRHFTELKDGAVGKATELKDWVVRHFTGLKDGAVGKATELRDWVVRRFTDLKDGAVGKATELKDWVVRHFTELRDGAVQKATELKDWAVQKVTDLRDGAVGKATELRDWVVGKVTDLRDLVVGKFIDLKDKAVDAFNRLHEGIGVAMDGVKRAAAVPINFVIQTVYDDGIKAAWDKVASFVGLAPLPYAAPVQFASGGQLPFGPVGPGMKTDGPRAIVGEGDPRYPEYVIPTDPAHRSRAVGLWSEAGGDLQMLAAGGVLGDVWGWVTDKVGGVTDWIGSKASQIGDFASAVFSDPKKALLDLLSGVDAGLGQFAGSGIGQQMLKMPGKVIDGLVGKVSDAVKAMTAGGFSGAGGPAPAGQVNDWITQALTNLGFPLSYAGGIYQQIMSESSGNPNAVQHGYVDVNTISGDLAKGIMQTISSTFNRWATPGHTNIFNPVDNIMAATRYANAKYGPGWFAQGSWHSHGYDSGGILPPGMTAAINATGQNERVLTPAQNVAFERLVAHATAGGSMPSQFTLTGGQVEIIGDGLMRIVNAQLQAAGTAINTGKRL